MGINQHEKVCDATQCVYIADVYSNIATRLKGKVVGYECCVGSTHLGGEVSGDARTAANHPVRPFQSSTKISVASVGKVFTAIAAIRMLDGDSGKYNSQLSLDSAIGGHLPNDWSLDPAVASITFRQLLSHRSGIKDYANHAQDYVTLKQFFTQQPVDPTKINPNDKSPFYSNYNFAIFRVLLPLMMPGFVDYLLDPDTSRAQNFADAYVKLVQKYVFEPVGAEGVDTKPPATGPQANAYAYSYDFPGTAAGFDPGDDTLLAGAGGWYVSVDDISKVLFSLNMNDERIVTHAQMQDMETTPLGWDSKVDSTGYRWVQKNGGSNNFGASIALFGPGVFGALFLNSTYSYSETAFQDKWKWCNKCQALTFSGTTNVGNCPAGGQHDPTGSGTYLVPTTAGGLTSQQNWRWCNKCQALAYTGSASVGACSGGGMHDHSGSGNYSLCGKGDGPLPNYVQDNWRWCNKCQVLAYAGNSAGACAGGGLHDHTGSGDYFLAGAVGADSILHDSYMDALQPKA